MKKIRIYSLFIALYISSSSIKPTSDPRIIGLVVAGVSTSTAGVALLYSTLKSQPQSYSYPYCIPVKTPKGPWYLIKTCSKLGISTLLIAGGLGLTIGSQYIIEILDNKTLEIRTQCRVGMVRALWNILWKN